MVAASAGPGAGEVDNGSDLRRLVTPPYPSTTTPLQLIDPSPEAFDQEFKSFAWKCKTSLVFVSRSRSIGWIEVSRTPLSHHPGFVLCPPDAISLFVPSMAPGWSLAIGSSRGLALCEASPWAAPWCTIAPPPAPSPTPPPAAVSHKSPGGMARTIPSPPMMAEP